MAQVGTEGNPLRVAIIGAGPTGFYSADHLQKQKDLVVEIDLYDRLPTPFGLVRGGVAPDHQKIKTVTKAYDRIAAKPNFRFFGYVELGTDVTVELLKGLLPPDYLLHRGPDRPRHGYPWRGSEGEPCRYRVRRLVQRSPRLQRLRVRSDPRAGCGHRYR